MSDPWVLATQKWLNATYPGKFATNPLPEDGVTGWKTVYALTRALQVELGITALADNFGTGTMNALTAFGDITPATSNQNIVTILIGGLYCKGYNAGNGTLSGVWQQMLSDAVFKLQTDIGVLPVEAVSPKLFKAILNMDAFVRVGGGTDGIRQVQQWMNATYLGQSWFDIVPCDGSFSRTIQVMLVYAIQTELGVTGANGNYGSGTRATMKAKAPVKIGDADASGKHWVRLFQAALRFNHNGADFTGTFSSNDANVTYVFQEFAGLATSSQGDYQTWSELLVSTGDPDRVGQACDTATILTPAMAGAIKASGRNLVGRYLTGTVSGGGSKALTAAELETIFAAELAVFPIFEENSTTAAYFTDTRGTLDAQKAIQAAAGLGFPRSTVIYFAVDFDPTDAQITSAIIPYFQAVKRVMATNTQPYGIGVYGTRNVCAQLAAGHLAQSSFVAGLSTGFSGNLGFPLPPNWAFNQISTITVGTGASAVAIDNDITSGHDLGQATLYTQPNNEALDIEFDPILTTDLATELASYCASVETGTVLPVDPDPRAALDALLNYDTLITTLSRTWGIRKAMIQTVSFWEYWNICVPDLGADELVASYYTYMTVLQKYEEAPVGPPPVLVIPTKDDSSTGFAQIFARTAIWAHNWAVERGLAEGPTWDESDWHQMWEVWQQLRDSDTFNLSTVPAVLLAGAVDVGIVNVPRLDFTADETIQILARYNGTNQDARDYGHKVKPIYDIFETYNAALRG